MRQNSLGYSLYEFVAVLIIISIIVSMALPVMREQTIENNNQTTLLQLQAIVKFAQEEAIRRNSNDVVICSANFNTNSILSGDNCDAGDGDWSEGIIAFINLNQSSSPAYNSGERINAIRFDNGVTVTMSGTSNNNQLTINSLGQLSNAVTFRLQQNKFGLCRYWTYSLNIYGAFNQTAGSQAC